MRRGFGVVVGQLPGCAQEGRGAHSAAALRNHSSGGFPPCCLQSPRPMGLRVPRAQWGFRLGSPLSLWGLLWGRCQLGPEHPALPSTAQLSDSHRSFPAASGPPGPYGVHISRTNPRMPGSWASSWAGFCWSSGSSTCCCSGPVHPCLGAVGFGNSEGSRTVP